VSGDYQIIKILEEKNVSNGSYYCIAKCKICGNEKKILPSDFIRQSNIHSFRNCGESVLKEEIGRRYGDLIITEYIGCKSNNHKYKAKCMVCNREKEVWIKDIKKGHGIKHKNCSELLPKNNITKRLRNIWSKMVDRCTNKNNAKYHCYGGRGIKTNYINFIDFYDDMFESYIAHVEIHGEKETTLDRINVNGDYIKDNLRWATWETQFNNTRRLKTIKIIYPDGKIEIAKNISKYARDNKLDTSSIYDCLNKHIKSYRSLKFEYI